MSSQSLIEEFSTPTYDQWRAEVEAMLKGAPFDKKMYTPIPGGITLKPLYRGEDTAGLEQVNSLPGFAPYLRGRDASGYLADSWEISQEISSQDPSAFNLAARYDLDRGLTALNMVLDQATRNGHDPDWAEPGEVGNGGLSISTLDDLKRALESIDLSKISLFVRSGSSALPFASLLMALLRRRGQGPDSLQGCIEMDPLGVAAHEGRLPHSLDGAYREMAELTRWSVGNAPKLQTICVHSRSWHEGGGTPVQELAFSLATGVEYLRAMGERGLDVDTVAPRIRFAVTVGSEFFTEIAKLRAARLLWSRAVEAFGGVESSRALNLHVRTAKFNKTTFDPYVNMLRTTVEAFAGVLGGANSMQVGPFDEVVRTPDDFSRRIARNTQLILQKECQLDRLIDPAGGSWYVESLTNELAEKAWKLFQEVERQGGMAVAMRQGFPQQQVADAGSDRLKQRAQRRVSVIGTNQYANPRESLLKQDEPANSSFQHTRAARIRNTRTSALNDQNTVVLDKLGKIVNSQGGEFFESCIEAAQAGATLGEITRALRISDPPDAPIIPVCLFRGSYQFEFLRRSVAPAGEKPQIFVACVGALRKIKPRADYSKAFFEISGAKVEVSAPFKTAEEAAQAAAASGAPVAVFCAIDDDYPAMVPAFIDALKAANPEIVRVLAGYPADHVKEFQNLGIQHFIHVKCNALDTLVAVLAGGKLLDAETARKFKEHASK